MLDETIKQFIDLGVTGAFLIYLYVRNGRAEAVLDRINNSMEKNSESIERNTKVLIKVAQKHKLMDEADELMVG